MRAFELLTRIAFGVASMVLMLLACSLIFYALSGVWDSFRVPDRNIGTTALDAVGYTVIAIAVFDVGKYLLEEESIRSREMRNAAEARRSLTKFVSTIIIAVLLEALVTVFEVAKEDPRLMLYPTMLLFAGVLLMVGLGVFQHLSVTAETKVQDPKQDD